MASRFYTSTPEHINLLAYSRIHISQHFVVRPKLRKRLYILYTHRQNASVKK